MRGGGGNVMALPMTLLAGLLIFSSVKAGDIADGSTNHGLLSKYMPSQSESSKSSIGDTGKFMAHHLNRVELGERPAALSDHYGLADDNYVTSGSAYPDENLEGGEVIAMPTVGSPFTTRSDELVHPTVHSQDTMGFTVARAGHLKRSKEFEPKEIANKEEDKDVQQLLTNENNKPIGLFTIGVALLSYAAMVGVRMRRRMQPAIALASSGRSGIDMSLPLATFSGDLASSGRRGIGMSPTPAATRHITQRLATAIVEEQPKTDVYWNDQELVEILSTKTFAKVANLVSEATIKECSRGAALAFESQGGHDGMYLKKPWKNSRIYYDARRVWTPEDATFWEPLIKEVRRGIATRFGLGDDLERALPLEAAFVNYYVGLPGQPRDMQRHVDCDPDGLPVPLSVVVQGVYENGEWGDILGTLDCQTTFDSEVEAVEMRAGDAAVLARAVHRPRPVPENEKRMAFVLFFSEINPTGA